MEKQNFETKWNWGAFVHPISFGVGNRAYLSLLALIPIFNLVWIFIVGAKGESWALANPENKYRDEVEFRSVMDTWKRGGFVQFIIIAVLLGLEILFIVFTLSMTLTAFSTFEHQIDNQSHYSTMYDDDDDYNYEDSYDLDD